MPEISRFYGIVVRMFFNDHNPPHFHASYGEYDALIGIRSLDVFAGDLPARARAMTVEWAALHQQELMDDWERARSHEPLHVIDPLP